MRKDAGRRSEAGAIQHRRPEQRVEVDDVLADEVIRLRSATRHPVFVEVQFFVAIAVMQEAGQVTDWCIQPDVKVLVFGPGYLKAEIRRVPGNVPVLEACLEPFFEFAGDVLVQFRLFHPFA